MWQASRNRNVDMNMNTTNTGSSFSQWGMQTMQNAYQKTSNAIGKAIKKNKVKKWNLCVSDKQQRDQEVNVKHSKKNIRI